MLGEISYKFLQAWTARRQMSKSQIRYLTAFLQIHSFQIFAVLLRFEMFYRFLFIFFHQIHLSQSLETDVSKLMTSRNLQSTQMRIIVRQGNQRRIGKLTALADTQLTQIWAVHGDVAD